MTVLRSGSATDVGQVRSVNEDLAFEGSALFAVADGMGGHAGGEVAARTAIDSLRSRFEHTPTAEGLVEAVHEANQAVWDKGHADPSLRGMGTTLTAAALVGTEQGDRLVLVNVGDSRAYRLRGDQFGQLTVDHSVAEELVARGELSESEAMIHPHRHILTRALGVDPDVEVDMWEIVPEEGDRFLLCSDGLTNEVPAEQIGRVLAATPDPNDAAHTLVRMANDSGGNDNITAVVVDVLVGEGGTADGNHDHKPEGVVRTAPVLGFATGSLGSAKGGAASTTGSVGVATGGTRIAGPTGIMGRTEEERSAEGSERPTTRHPPLPRPAVPRRVTLRVLLFVVVLGGIGYGAWSLVRWYVDNSYFVGFHNGKVAIFEGRRGGFLGMDPKLVISSDLTASELPSVIETSIASGVEEPSRSAAEQYVSNLRSELCSQVPPPAGVSCPTPTPSSPTTTVPPSKKARTSALPVRGLRTPRPSVSSRTVPEAA